MWKNTINNGLTWKNVQKVCMEEGLFDKLREANKNLEYI